MPLSHRIVRATALVSLSAGAVSQSPSVNAQELAPMHAPVVLLEDDEARFQLLVDLDDDGQTDVVGSRVRSDGLAEIVVWRNDGGTLSRVFTTTAALAAAGGAYRAPTLQLAAGDIDGDGDIDVIGGAGNASLHLLNVGNFQLASLPYSHSYEVRDVTTGDVDGDGIADAITVVARDYAPFYTELEVRTQNGIFTSNDLIVLGGRGRVRTLDADGNGDLEIAVCSRKFVRTFDLQNGSLVLTNSLITSQTSDYDTMWDVGDFDGDGDVDIVGFEPSAGTLFGPQVHLLRNTGTGLVVETGYRGGPAEYLADIDGDGDLDGICCGGGYGGGSPTWPNFGQGSTFEFALNEGGVFQESISFPGYGSLSMAGMADLNGDGHLDAVAGACVFYGVGPWARQPMPRTLSNLNPSPSLFTDFDSDGDVDVNRRVLGGGGENDGNGFFTDSPSQANLLPAGTYATLGGYVGDFDGDGDVDEVRTLLYPGSPPIFAQMAFFENNGSGVFRYSGMATPPGLRLGPDLNADEALVGDLDGDGDLDVIGSRDPFAEPRYCRLARNDGTGHFTAWVSYTGERVEALGDFDSDGITDLLMSAEAGGGTLHLRLGTGSTPPFGAPLAAFPGALVTEVNRVTAADANGDGRLDVLVANTSSPVRLYDNQTGTTGNPVFGVATVGYPQLGTQTSSIFRNPIRVNAFDVNGDGRTDLVMGPVETGTYHQHVYIRRSGVGSTLDVSAYEDPIVQLIPNGFAADMDGDGDLDIAGRFVTSNVRSYERNEFRRQYGRGTAGEASVTPLLGATGDLVACGTKMLHLRGVTGPTLGILAIGFAEAELNNVPLPGVKLLLDPTFLLTQTLQIGAPSNDKAESGLDYAVHLPPTVAGYEFFDQVFVLDPAGPSGVSASNGLHVQIRS